MIAGGPDIASAYWQFKLWFIDHTFARDALHIHLALILFFGSMLLFRWRLGDWRPWFVVLAAAMIGDGWDILDALMRSETVYWSSDLPDIWNTLFWPSAMTAMGRYTRTFRDGGHNPAPSRRGRERGTRGRVRASGTDSASSLTLPPLRGGPLPLPEGEGLEAAR